MPPLACFKVESLDNMKTGHSYLLYHKSNRIWTVGFYDGFYIIDERFYIKKDRILDIFSVFELPEDDVTRGT